MCTNKASGVFPSIIKYVLPFDDDLLNLNQSGLRCAKDQSFVLPCFGMIGFLNGGYAQDSATRLMELQLHSLGELAIEEATGKLAFKKQLTLARQLKSISRTPEPEFSMLVPSGSRKEKRNLRGKSC